MNRDWLLRGLVAVLLVGGGVWLASATEWVDVEVPLPASGEAAKNDLYATQQLLRRLGATVATPSDLAQLPPPRATLLLTSWYWDLFPDRAKRLKAWVESGGHLVLFANNLDHEQLKGWLPIKEYQPPRKPKKPEAEDEEDAPSPVAEAASAVARRLGPPCHDTSEPDSVPASYTDGDRHFKLCAHVFSARKLQSSTPPLWALDGPHGPLLMRAARGQGQVTVILPFGLLDNDRVLKQDNALVAVAALQARAGAHIWFVTEEARPPILVWLWQEAWVVVVLGFMALALALWRGARRFGPLVAAKPPGRRSMVEQITGTAQFLRRQGPDALLGAQIRALEAAARTHVRHYDKLDRSQRAAAIAKMTGQDAAALGLALDKSLARRRTALPDHLPATLELLETARRLLVQRDRTPRR